MPLTKIDDRGLTTPVDLQDNEKLRFGIGNDLEIYHNGSNTYLKNSTGWLNIISDTVFLGNSADTKAYLKAVNDGSVELYYNNAKKLETVNTGVVISGKLETTGFLSVAADNQDLKVGAGDDIKIFHDGTDSYLQNATGDLYIQTTGSGDDIFISAIDDVQINVGGETAAKFIDDGAVELYHNNTKKFETTSSGVDIAGNCTITGNFRGNDNVKLNLGNGDDLQIYHDGTNNWFWSGGGHPTIHESSSSWTVRSVANENYIVATENGSVDLYHDGGKKFASHSNGLAIKNEAGGSSTSLYVIGPEGESAEIQMNADDGDDNSDYYRLIHMASDNSWRLQNYHAGSWGDNIRVLDGAEVKLYYDNNLKFETSSTGNQSTGVHKFISGSGSTSSDDNVVHIVAGSTASRGIMLGTGRATGASQNDGMGYIDAIDSESSSYGAQLQFRIGGTRVMVVGYNSNNNVGIGNDYPLKKLTVQADTNTHGIFLTNDDDYDSGWGFQADSSSGALKIDRSIDNNFGYRRATFHQDGGLCFGQDTAAANALDDYEEGTWTPTTNGGTLTVATAHYVKIGKIVMAQAYVTFPSMSGGTTVELNGYPFTTNTGSDFHSAAVNSDANLNTQLCGQFVSTTMKFATENNTKANFNQLSGKFVVVSVVYTVH